MASTAVATSPKAVRMMTSTSARSAPAGGLTRHVRGSRDARRVCLREHVMVLSVDEPHVAESPGFVPAEHRHERLGAERLGFPEVDYDTGDEGIGVAPYPTSAALLSACCANSTVDGQGQGGERAHRQRPLPGPPGPPPVSSLAHLRQPVRGEYCDRARRLRRWCAEQRRCEPRGPHLRASCKRSTTCSCRPSLEDSRLPPGRADSARQHLRNLHHVVFHTSAARNPREVSAARGLPRRATAPCTPQPGSLDRSGGRPSS